MVNPIISHTTYIAIGIIAVVMIVAAIYGLQENIRIVDKTAKLDYAALIIENKILELDLLATPNFEAKTKIDPYAYNETLLEMSSGVITLTGNGIQVTREIGMDISGKQYLPAYLLYKNGAAQVIQ